MTQAPKNRINQKTLAKILANNLNISKRAANEFLNEFNETIIELLVAGHTINLIGLGTFKVIERHARNGVDPQTLTQIKIPFRRVPKFRVGNKLKTRINKGLES